MLISDKTYLDRYKTPAREVKGQIVFSAENLQGIIAPHNTLKSFKIESISPNGKFFGFAITKRIVVEVLGILELPKGTKLVPSIYTVGDSTIPELPSFYVDTVDYNKVSKTTTITGYDILNTNRLFKEIMGTITYPVLASDFLAIVAQSLGGTSTFNAVEVSINQAPNIDGSETIQTILAALAEICGAICYVNKGNNINFRTVSKAVEDQLTTADYFDFSYGDKAYLTQLASKTALGNDITSGAGDGFTFVFWDNPFLNLLPDEDVTRILYSVGDRLLGYSNSNYNLVWRGCPAYELGDYIAIEETDGDVKYIYYLNETLTYNGGLKVEAYWELAEEEHIEGTPNNISKSFGQAYAKVDKINREITLLVEETEGALEEISSIKMNAEGVLTEVQSITTRTNDMIEATNDSIDTLSKKVQQSITSENMSVIIQQELSNGVDAVTTKTGFTFDEVGLTIEKTGSEMSTTITEDGMTVYRDDNPVLIANNIGVEAINLYATTYLIIGSSSRLEDYEDQNGSRTGCFWVGR